MSTSSPQMDPDTAGAPAAGSALEDAGATLEAAGVEHGSDGEGNSDGHDQAVAGPSTTATDKGPDSRTQPSTIEDSYATTPPSAGGTAGAPAGEMAVNGSSEERRGEVIENGDHERQQAHSGDEDARSTGEHDDAQGEGAGHTDNGDRIAELEAELNRVTNEKDTLESQYRGLLGKLTNMRNTLGDKLRQDAEELDRREQQIVDLQATNEDLQETVETLKSELIGNNDECERLHAQVEQLRLRADDSAKAIMDESSLREVQLREVSEDLERCRLEREDWENQAMKERVDREKLETGLNAAERELAQLRHEKQALTDERDREAESAANLHAVLEEFQAAKDNEIRATLGDMQSQLQHATRSLQEYRQRAHAAEGRLAASQSDTERTAALEKEVKDKNLHIGKLRHEAVILNEHLIEALRRLKKGDSENNVDRRLVTNVLITFFNTPRADSKRFEMLSLLASILSWSDEDRERAGLQRNGSSGVSSNGAGAKPNISLGSSRRRAMSRATSAFAGKGKGPEDSFADAGGEGLEQSFSNLWVEYLLRESQSGSPPASTASSHQSILPPLSSPNSQITSPPLPSSSRTMSPFAELAPPSSPSKSTSSASTAGKRGAPPLGRQRSDTDTSESVFSRIGETSTAATSIVSGH